MSVVRDTATRKGRGGETTRRVRYKIAHETTDALRRLTLSGHEVRLRAASRGTLKELLLKKRYCDSLLVMFLKANPMKLVSRHLS
jgi:hypothetical protein